eukprot:gene6673-4782_t
MESSVPAHHPLMAELGPIFAELHAGNGADELNESTLTSAIARLEHILEEEHDALSFRNNLRVAGAGGRAMAAWMNQQLKELFEKDATMRAGVRVMRALFSVEYMDVSDLSRIFSGLLLRATLRSPRRPLASDAAALWGFILQTRGNAMVEIAKDVLVGAMELLSRDPGAADVAEAPEPLLRLVSSLAGDHRTPEGWRFAACLLVHQVVEAAPALAAPHVDAIILTCLRRTVVDSDAEVRRTGAQAMLQALRLAYKSPTENYQAYQDVLLGDVVLGISRGTAAEEAVAEGNLLLFNAVMASLSTGAGLELGVGAGSGTPAIALSPKSKLYVNQVAARINDELLPCQKLPAAVCDVLHKSLPLLALYDRQKFLGTTALRVQQVCHSAFTAPNAFTAHGADPRPALFTLLTHLTAVVPEFVFAFLDQLMGYIEAALEQREERSRCQEAATCFATLAQAEPKAVRPYLRSIMGPLFSGPVTTALAADVAKVCTAFPGLRSTCLAKVLASATEQLSRSPRQALTTPNAAEQTQFILRKFEALEQLDFTGYSTLHFLCQSVVPYVTDLHEDVRRSAIQLCFKLVLSGCTNSPCRTLESGAVIHCGQEHTQLVQRVVEKLCHAAVADANSDLRLQTLQRFTPAFDHTLSLLDPGLLSPALFDKFHNVTAAAHLLGRISVLHPVGTYPALRRVVLQSLSDVRYFRHPKPHEQGICLIAAVAESAPEFIRPYLPALLRSCAQRLQEDTQPAAVTTALLSCAGKLARHAEGADIEVVRGLQCTVVQHILDSSSPLKKHEAIRALCDVVRTTRDANVLEADESHRRLLGALMSSLHGGHKERLVVRLDILKLLGILGAVDPHRVKRITRHLRDTGAKWAGIAALDSDNSMYPQHVIHHILEVLKLPSVTVDQYVCAVRVVTQILSLNNTPLVGYHPAIIQTVLQHTTQFVEERSSLLPLLTRTAEKMGPYIRPFARRIVQEVVRYLPAEPETLRRVLDLFRALRRTMREEFRSYLRDILPALIQSVQDDLPGAAPHVFLFYCHICPLLDTMLHMVLPSVCEVAGSKSAPLACREAATRAIGNFGRRLPSFLLEAPRCIHCLCAVLKEHRDVRVPTPTTTMPLPAGEPAALVRIAVDALSCIAWNLGPQFDKFTPLVLHVLEACGAAREEAARRLLRSARGEEEPAALVSEEPPGDETEEEEATSRRNLSKPPAEVEYRHSELERLLQAKNFESMDWGQWVAQLSVGLLQLSPSPSHRMAEQLAVKHPHFAQHIFHSAFRVMYEHRNLKRSELLRALDRVLRSADQVPPEVLQALLNLSEYMERVMLRSLPIHHWGPAQRGLLFDVRTLMDCSERCHLYAKALHYVELQLYDDWSKLLELCEKSIYLYNLLGHRESAESILQYIETNFSFLTGMPQSSLSKMMDAALFEKLQWWSEGQRAYFDRLQQEPDHVPSMVGYMRSLDNLGNYNRLLEAWKRFSVRLGQHDLQQLAPYGAHAAWLLRRWDDMREIASHMAPEGSDGMMALFYQAVAAVSQRQVYAAERLIQQCRRRLDSQVSTLVAESYDRAYSMFIEMQLLCELEECLLAFTGHRPVEHWRDLWERRLGAMAYEGWAGAITNHAIVIPQSDELGMWLKFVALSRLNGHEFISSEILSQLRGHRSIEAAISTTAEQTDPLKPSLALASFQHLYDTDQRLKALPLLAKYVNIMAERTVQADQVGSLALCHSKLAYWLFTQSQSQQRSGVALLASNAPVPREVAQQILEHLTSATKLDDRNGIIWHTWARIHAAMALSQPSPSTPEDRRTRAHHVVMAVKGYVSSMCLTRELEDALGFLSLWFTFGADPEVRLSKGVADLMLGVPATVWLKVLPQIIARLQSDDEFIAESVFRLLAHVAEEHPQALLYALSVANASYHWSTADTSAASPSPAVLERKKGAAERLLMAIAEYHRDGRRLVTDAALVCEEVVRCAALWPEKWYEALQQIHQAELEHCQESLRVWIQPLMEELRRPVTNWEKHFAAELGPALEDWYNAMLLAVSKKDNARRKKTMEDWKTVLGRIGDARANIVKQAVLSLSTVSPALATRGRDLSLVVPGQYKPDGAFPCIAYFEDKLQLIATKQMPRRLYLIGTDGVRYNYLLKGHGDLRLDERVMQLLSCVNTLLEKHSATQQRDCAIQVYSVTPLSENAGLVGWVDDSHTLQFLIHEYRRTDENLMLESRAMQSEVIQDHKGCVLRPIQLLEQLEKALETNPGTDLANSFWMRAPSAEVWLDRRTTYVCSLATMSMVGHILGLGDRHPSNLMIHAYSGRVVHIDFGECFEAAQLRLLQPENVPFRLTRMLVKALEVGGINGLFRHGCVTAMGILRREGSSILALLEAFVHDPLVSWWAEELEEAPDEAQRHALAKLLERYQEQELSLNSALNQLAGSHMLHRITGSAGTMAPVARMCRETGTILYHRPQFQDCFASKPQRVVNRIQQKLEGLEFRSVCGGGALNVESQVSRLIQEARSLENICTHYPGWCPFW